MADVSCSLSPAGPKWPITRTWTLIFREWPYQQGVISARLIRAGDGREVLQMRIEMGLLQMEVSGRPDGAAASRLPTYLEWLRKEAWKSGGPSSCSAKSNAWKSTANSRSSTTAASAAWPCGSSTGRRRRRPYAGPDGLRGRAFAREQWTHSHERYRPFVSFHRVQAVALAALERDRPEAAIEEITTGWSSSAQIFVAAEAEEQFEEDELVTSCRIEGIAAEGV